MKLVDVDYDVIISFVNYVIIWSEKVLRMSFQRINMF